MSIPLTTSDATPAAEKVTDVAPSHWLGWAVFLGVSWTWCIGMFLPVILVRDYGFWAWLVFAVPNVLGAAAMGWVLRSGQGSIEISSIHEPACRIFSAVTIAFHLFFVVAVIAPLGSSITSKDQTMETLLGAVLTIATLMYVYMTRRGGGDRVLAWGTLAISLVAMFYVTLEVSDIARVNPEKMHPLGMRIHQDLLWLTPVCIFGFLGCPYLDLTFHRARQFANAPKKAFGMGFGAVFFTMILFTLVYARAFASNSVTGWIAIFLVVHLAVQSAYTIAAHARELRYRGEAYAILAAGLALLAWLAYWFLPDTRLVGRLYAGEIIYRIFMGFYGLLFPTYVWLIMLPGKGHAAPTTRNLVVFSAAVIAALPMFWMGFVAQKMIWLAPGLTLVLLARLLIQDPSRVRGFDVIQQNSAPT
jgi:hypothetical protein